MYFVYLIKCKDGTIYTGITTDVKRRFVEHKEGKGGHYTRSRGSRNYCIWKKRAIEALP